VRERGLQSDTQ